MTTHIMIPDIQAKPDEDLSYCDWIGRYLAHKQPDVIVQIGDLYDFPSLSSYDRGKKCMEGRRVQADIKAGDEAAARLMAPINKIQKRQRKAKKKVYSPRWVLTMGNHSDRLTRHIEAHPELDGVLSLEHLGVYSMGWEVHPFLKPVTIDGVTYAHYMANPMSGKPYGGSASNILNKVGESFIMGHKQTLDIATRFLPSSGRQQWGIIAGACYPFDEGYKGYQGNKHWRGLLLLHSVRDGSFGLTTVSLDYLKEKYGNG